MGKSPLDITWFKDQVSTAFARKEDVSVKIRKNI
jgi:hypothetical protein